MNANSVKVDHFLKCEKPYYQHCIDGIKPFEVRKNDRNFKMYENIALIEIDAEKEPTSRSCNFQINYILQGERWGIKEGFVVLGIKKL